ncbi:MAG: ABC transporter ATP-binding protein [Actinobacteria bacterium]|nr:ABC transporter ATP-binding protein [Actinomycetota bacterium]
MSERVNNYRGSGIKNSGDNIAVDIKSVSKMYRIYHEKIPSLKNTILTRKRTTYEEFLALDNVSFAVNNGQTFGIIGPNGSGKSTLLKLMAKIFLPTCGEVIVNGSLSALLELGAGFHPDLTGRENIYINSAILGMRKREVDKRFDQIVRFSELEKFIDTPVKNYSSGMYMRLGFSIAINVNPDILLVDEVLAVGDQSFQAKCYKAIYDIMKRGKTIIIVSHDLETISDLCSRAAFLKEGKIVDLGNPIRVVSQYRAYVEELEKKRAEDQQREERKKIFKTVIESNIKVVDGEDIEKLSRLDSEQAIKRFGSGDAMVTDIRLLDENENKLDYCKYGDEVKIALDIKFNRKVEGPIFGIRITDIKDNIVYGTNTRTNNLKTEVYDKDESLRVEFAFKVTIIGGNYYVTPAVGYKDSKTYCDWVNNMLTINVLKNEKAEGIANLNSKITIEKIS